MFHFSTSQCLKLRNVLLPAVFLDIKRSLVIYHSTQYCTSRVKCWFAKRSNTVSASSLSPCATRHQLCSAATGCNCQSHRRLGSWHLTGCCNCLALQMVKKLSALLVCRLSTAGGGAHWASTRLWCLPLLRTVSLCGMCGFLCVHCILMIDQLTSTRNSRVKMAETVARMKVVFSSVRGDHCHSQHKQSMFSQRCSDEF